MTDQERIDAALARYNAAAHAMQSGVAMEMNFNPSPATNKHLRVGVNSAMVTDQAIATILLAKGIFTLVEYHEALADAMEAEKARYIELLSKITGANINLA